MKTKTLFLAVLVMVSNLVFAGNDKPTAMAVLAVKGSEVYKVIYKSATSGKVKLYIHDQTGKIIFAETFNGLNGFICPVNFKGMAPGEYTIELIDGAGRNLEKISFQPSVDKNYIHISKLLKEDNKFLVSVPNMGSNQIKVNIFDGNNNMIHTESKKIEGNFAQVYKIHNYTGSYTFVVSDNLGNNKSASF